MTDMLSTVRLAICRRTHTGGQCVEPGNCCFCDDASYAALEALRSPTEAMMTALARRAGCINDAEPGWQAAIDEALKDPRAVK